MILDLAEAVGRFLCDPRMRGDDPPKRGFQNVLFW